MQYPIQKLLLVCSAKVTAPGTASVIRWINLCTSNTKGEATCLLWVFERILFNHGNLVVGRVIGSGEPDIGGYLIVFCTFIKFYHLNFCILSFPAVSKEVLHSVLFSYWYDTSSCLFFSALGNGLLWNIPLQWEIFPCKKTGKLFFLVADKYPNGLQWALLLIEVLWRQVLHLSNRLFWNWPHL